VRTDRTVVTKNDSNLAPGDVVSGLEASELVEIQRVAPFGAKTLVERVGLQSRRMVWLPLTAEKLAALVKVRGQLVGEGARGVHGHCRAEMAA
jgi:hypothetical protein